MYRRLVNILEEQSFFLFGARATGKSYLLEQRFGRSKVLWIDLLDDDQFLALTKRPRQLEQLMLEHFEARRGNTSKWVVIDEVQRIPKLLNEVHRLLESPEWRNKVKFALTGSSARKLKRLGSNMLAGRALLNRLFPLTFEELSSDFNLDRVLNWGSLPGVFCASNDPQRAAILRSYVATYLSEEIREEQIVRQLDPFVRFLEVAAQSSGLIVNYSSIGRDCQVDSKAVARYFQILEDTLLGFFLPAYSKSVRKQQSQASRFLLFDLGVQRALRGALAVPVVPSNYEYGRAFEQLVILEIYRLNQYRERDLKLSYLRTKDGAEIDLIVEDPRGPTWLIEVKSSANVNDDDVAKLSRFLPTFSGACAVVLSRDPAARRVGDVRILPWQEGIREIIGV
jgi:predicted AAA+ superfamily ATPase